MEDWFQLQIKKLKARSEAQPSGCILWIGGPCPQIQAYGRVRVKLPVAGSKSQVMYVHRLAYMTSRRVLELSPGLEVSHLCHQARCVEPTHLCLETHSTNQERVTCHLQGICTKNHVPHCIIIQ